MKSSKPYQYTNGWVEFYKLKFKVTPDVLIPRPETELLVDEILRFIGSNPDDLSLKASPLFILDVGTGCGNIAISLAKNLTSHLKGGNVKIIATDISKKALKVAKQNAKFHGVLNKIIFLQSDLLENLLDQSNHPNYYDKLVYHSELIIVTNLPYIPSARIPYLDPSVKDFEPKLALDGGEDGFDLYRKLFKHITKLHLTHPMCKLKLLVGEVDYTHGEIAVNEALKYFPEAQIEVKTDLAHKQRILIIS